MSRDYRHLPVPGVSFALDHQSGIARIAVSLCHDNDRFSRDTAKTLLDLMLDAPNETLNACNLTRNVYRVYYLGKKPREHVLKPLIESLVDVLNERALYRELKSLFLLGVNTYEAAREIAKERKDDSYYKRFQACAKILESAGDLKLLGRTTSLEDFESLFFTWSGSAEAVLDGVVKFTINFDPRVHNSETPTETNPATPAAETQSETSVTPPVPDSGDTPIEVSVQEKPVADLNALN